MATATAARAAEKEVRKKTHSYKFKTKTFTFPSTIEMLPVDVLEAYEANQWAGFVHGVIGDKQWAVFKAMDPTIADLKDFSAALDRAYADDQEA